MNRIGPPIAACLAVLSACSARADLYFERPQANLGRIRSGTPLTERFTFVNRGDKDVTITGVQTTCGCLSPRLELRSYRPGEAGVVPIEINSLSQPSGPHSWRLQIHYTDGGEPLVQTLEVLANLT